MHTPGATRPHRPARCVGRCLRDRFDRQPLHLHAAAVARDARVAGVDDVADAGHRQRRLGHVGGQHHAAAGAVRCEHLLLLGGRQPGIQRQHLGVCEQSGQSLRGVADFALAGQEHQHVAGRFGLEFADCVDDGLDLVAGLGADDLLVGIVGIVGAVGVVFGAGGHDDFQWAVTDFDGVGPPGHFDDGRPSEMRRKPLRLDGRRRDDDLQVGTARQQLAQVAEQEVDVEAALVGLVEDQGVVAQQPAVALDLGQQDAVGHQLDQRAVADLVGEPHRVADGVPERAAQLVGDALRDRAGGEPTGLGVADGAADPAADLEADLGQLGGLARARGRRRPRPPGGPVSRRRVRRAAAVTGRSG